MFKDQAKFHEARTHPGEDVGSLFKAKAKEEDMRGDEINPKGKREHPVDGAVLCSCKASKGSTLNPQSSRQNQPRTFSCYSAPLASVYEKLLEASSIKPLNPTPLPKNPPNNFKPNLYCTYHQMPGHSTNAYHCLRHAIQDLIDNGIIPAPLPAKANVVSNSSSQPNSSSQVGQISTISTQINSTSIQINPSSTIFNPTNHIVPDNQPKPIVSIPSETEVNLTAIGWAIEVFTIDTWIDSDKELTKEKTNWLRSFNHESLELLFKEFSQVGLVEDAEKAEVLMLGPDTLKDLTFLIVEAKGSF